MSSDKSNSSNAVATVDKKAGYPEMNQQVETDIDRPKQIGLSIAFLVFAVFGLWAGFAPIEGAAHAQGIIKVKSYNKTIQHLEGGIVKTINVQNGDFVNAGDVLLVMDPTQSLAQLEILNSQMLTYTALEARLVAERDGLDTVVFPPELRRSSEVANQETLAQQSIFITRKRAQEGSRAVLQQRISQLDARVEGLKAQLDSKTMLATSYQEELEDFQGLLDDGFTDKQRLRQLERSYAQSAGEAADLKATIASVEIQKGETQLQILQQENETQNEVANQLAETQTALKDIRERTTALSDIVARTEIKAPIAGIVNSLQIHTEGGVIAPGSPIAEIVPQSDDLIIEATVSPADIDRVAVGYEATVRLSAFNSHSVPNLHGTVLNLSADALVDANTGATYYQARIALTPESLEALQDFVLIPGMPAEVFISTGSRTFLQYVLKPLSNSVARGLKED